MAHNTLTGNAGASFLMDAAGSRIMEDSIKSAETSISLINEAGPVPKVNVL